MNFFTLQIENAELFNNMKKKKTLNAKTFNLKILSLKILHWFCLKKIICGSKFSRKMPRFRIGFYVHDTDHILQQNYTK